MKDNIKCPVCGEYEFEYAFEVCRVCGWENDPLQNRVPDYWGGANDMSLLEAREAYAKGEPIK